MSYDGPLPGDSPRHVTRIGDVLAPTFTIPNPLQQHTRYTVTGPSQQVNADAMLRSGRWVIVERKEPQ